MLPPSQEEIEETEIPFSPFAKVKQGDEQDKEIINSTDFILKTRTVQIDLSSQEQVEETKKEIVKPILKLEITEEEQKKVETYTKNPKLQEFIKELSTVITPEELDQENYLNVAFKPEVRAIFEKYASDEEFRETVTTIMKDKNFLQFADKIIKNNEVKK